MLRGLMTKGKDMEIILSVEALCIYGPEGAPNAVAMLQKKINTHVYLIAPAGSVS